MQQREVFISYSTKDDVVARSILSAIEDKGVKCWIAPRDIPKGVEFAEAIIAGIEECSIFVVVVSCSSNESNQVLREVNKAVSCKKTIIPFVIENLTLSKSMEYYLSCTQWVTAFTPPLDSYIKELLERILTLVKVDFVENKDEELSDLELMKRGQFPFGTYSSDREGERAEPILWRLIRKEGSRYLLISERIIDFITFTPRSERVNWSNSEFRSWLNGEFFEEAFTEEEKDKIVLSTIHNQDCMDTQDRVFFLNELEAKNLGNSVQAKSNEYALGRGLWVNKHNGCSPWWLRLCTEKGSTYMSSNGNFYTSGTAVRNDGGGVRPAIYVKL